MSDSLCMGGPCAGEAGTRLHVVIGERICREQRLESGEQAGNKLDFEYRVREYSRQQRSHVEDRYYTHANLG
eukprot:6447306-Pyramimonas_sp.AAC.1